MTQEFSDRQMTKEQIMRLDEVARDEYAKMKENQTELAESLERAAGHREQYPEMVIPTDDMIRDIHHGEMTDREMRDRAEEISHDVVNREAQMSFEEKLQAKLGEEKIEAAREEARQEQERKLGNDREQSY